MFRSRMLLWFLACTVLGASESALADPNVAPPQDQPKHVRVLTLGNSFTVNATRYLKEVTEAAGHKLTHKQLSIGGSPLELHAAKALAFEQDRSDRTAKY